MLKFLKRLLAKLRAPKSTLQLLIEATHSRDNTERLVEPALVQLMNFVDEADTKLGPHKFIVVSDLEWNAIKNPAMRAAILTVGLSVVFAAVKARNVLHAPTLDTEPDKPTPQETNPFTGKPLTEMLALANDRLQSNKTKHQIAAAIWDSLHPDIRDAEKVGISDIEWATLKDPCIRQVILALGFGKLRDISAPLFQNPQHDPSTCPACQTRLRELIPTETKTSRPVH